MGTQDPTDSAPPKENLSASSKPVSFTKERHTSISQIAQGGPPKPVPVPVPEPTLPIYEPEGISDYQHKIVIIGMENDRLQYRLTTANETLAEKCNYINYLKDCLAKSDTAMLELSQSNTDQQSIITQLRALSQKKDQSIAMLSSEKSEIEAQIASHNSDFDKNLEKIKSLEAHCLEADNSNFLESNMKLLISENERLSTSLSQATSILSTKEHDHQGIIEALKLQLFCNTERTTYLHSTNLDLSTTLNSLTLENQNLKSKITLLTLSPPTSPSKAENLLKVRLEDSERHLNLKLEESILKTTKISQ